MVDGGIKCWGSNSYNQLGIPNTITTVRFFPVDMSGLTGVVALSAGAAHTCALMSTGGVKCWGYNGSGQLGDGTTTTRFTPMDVSGLDSGVAAISAGELHTCALLVSGGIKCWGDNSDGQLGDGTTTNRLTPVDVSGLVRGVLTIAAGAIHTCVVMSTGGVKCWGSNSYGQLGDGTATNQLTPVDVSGLTSGVAAIAVRYSHSCALMVGGGVKCWGSNNYGQLGDGSTIGRSTPVDVSGLSSGVMAIATGEAHTCALMSVGSVKCWGDNMYGQVNVDDSNMILGTPQSVSGVTGIVTLSAGYDHTCALTVSGSVKCWGYNHVGQLGLGDGPIPWRRPGDVNGLTDVANIAAGYSFTCALMSTGSVKCWGYNGDGELGINNGWAPLDVVWFSTYLPIVLTNH
jgi:alpha-tubulin suppressor-like RCC1 family protein